jgi:hypothetical protein
MALIGQIAIAMVTDTTKFTQGLLGASAALKTFEKSAFVNIAKGSKAVTFGLNNINKGLKDITTGFTGRAGFGFASLVTGLNQFYGGLATVALGIGKLGLGYAVKGFQTLASVVGSTIHYVADLAKTTLFLGGVLGFFAPYFLWNVAQDTIALHEQTDRARIIFC